MVLVPRAINKKDYQAIKKHAHSNFADVIKTVKSVLKSPLAERHPILALHVAKTGEVNNELVIEDRHGNRLVLTDEGMSEEPASTYLLHMLPVKTFIRTSFCLSISARFGNRKIASQTVINYFERSNCEIKRCSEKTSSSLTVFSII